MAFGPHFFPPQIFFRGLGLILHKKQTTKNLTQPSSPHTPTLLHGTLGSSCQYQTGPCNYGVIAQPITQRTDQLITQRTDQPITQRTDQPSTQPTDQPSTQRTDQPSTQPTKEAKQHVDMSVTMINTRGFLLLPRNYGQNSTSIIRPGRTYLRPAAPKHSLRAQRAALRVLENVVHQLHHGLSVRHSLRHGQCGRLRKTNSQPLSPQHQTHKGQTGGLTIYQGIQYHTG